MKLSETFEQKLYPISEQLLTAHLRFSADQSALCCADRGRVTHFLDCLRNALFPGIYEGLSGGEDAVGLYITDSLRDAGRTLHALLDVFLPGSENEDELVEQFLGTLPRIRAMLELDIQAAYDGDPAAHNFDEILLSYPGFEAVMVYRFAHELYIRNVPVLPRAMTEHAHQRTGIDINPGAVIGRRFFIDHGTGVVVGETCTIGDNVKMYQGVTLGARSFDLDAQGNPIKGIKRHPDIEDDVVIYAGATILGGDTRIGRGSVIGGNVWLTHSVPPYSRVYNAQPDPIIR